MSALLHLVGFAPGQSDRLENLVRACSPGDTLVLLDAGLAFAEEDSLAELRTRLPECHIRVLVEEGDPASVPEPAQAIDAAGLVALTEIHRGPASWY